jgi:hypothetical protein
MDVFQSKRITIDSNPGETTLTIHDVILRDGGMYICVAKNKLGIVKQMAKLIVNGWYFSFTIKESLIFKI